MTAYRVRDGHQVNVNGTVHSSGQPLPDDLPDDLAERWLASGWITPATTTTTRTPRRQAKPKP